MCNLIKKSLSVFTAIVLIFNTALCAYADELAPSYNPALLPIVTWVTSVAVGTGIIGKNVGSAVNDLVDNVVQQIKYNEVLKATSDNTYNSPYRVINSNGQPEKPNNNNKNGRWFALGLASAGASAIAFEKGMVEDVANTFNELGAYSPLQGSIGIMSADGWKNQTTASAIALQLANISNSSVTQFDAFLHSSWWDDKDITPDNCWFTVNVDIPSILRDTPLYPTLSIKVYKKNDNLSFVDCANGIGYYTYSNQYGSLSYYYISSRSSIISFLDNNNVTLPIEYWGVVVKARDGVQEFSLNDRLSSHGTTASFSLTSAYRNGYVDQGQAYCGYKWKHETAWQFTNNVYNYNQTIQNQYPNWDTSSLDLLGQQIEALRIGIQDLNNPWDATQTQIQEGLSPEAVISQLLNNYLNPENIPEPEPEPEPEPGPEPEPEPEPVPESVLDTAVNDFWDWGLAKITLPDGFFDKIPFSIPYDCYLLIRSMFPSSGGGRRVLMSASLNSSVSNPNGITISSNYDASGSNTRNYSNQWGKTAPIVNLDLHFQYSGVDGQKKQLDIVKSVDLAPYSYFAMIIYIAIYISWFFTILGFISNMF